MWFVKLIVCLRFDFSCSLPPLCVLFVMFVHSSAAGKVFYSSHLHFIRSVKGQVSLSLSL